MVLEATMLVLDNSEYMRNGDYPPSRFEAQSDAVNVIFNRKTNSNPENAVGLMTMAGKGPEVLATLTQDIGKILHGLHNTKISGNASVSAGIQVAQLALKHRQDKNQRQRVIVFVGSPVSDEVDSLVRLGKKLKKNNVAVDVINFGEDAENEEKLAKFVEALNSGDNSHLLSVPAGPRLLSDIIVSSPILQDEDAMETGGAGGAGGEGFEFGVDPSMDPELAMALRMSLEEERARQQAAEAASRPSNEPQLESVPEGAAAPSTTTTAEPQPLAGSGSLVAPGAESITGASGTATLEEAGKSEDAMVQQALALSRGEGGGEAGGMKSEDVEMAGAGEGDEDEEMTEEEAIARAIEMSMQQNRDEGEEKK